MSVPFTSVEDIPYHCPKCGSMKNFATLLSLQSHLILEHTFQDGRQYNAFGKSGYTSKPSDVLRSYLKGSQNIEPELLHAYEMDRKGSLNNAKRVNVPGLPDNPFSKLTQSDLFRGNSTSELSFIESSPRYKPSYGLENGNSSPHKDSISFANPMPFTSNILNAGLNNLHTNSTHLPYKDNVPYIDNKLPNETHVPYMDFLEKSVPTVQDLRNRDKLKQLMNDAKLKDMLLAEQRKQLELMQSAQNVSQQNEMEKLHLELQLKEAHLQKARAELEKATLDGQMLRRENVNAAKENETFRHHIDALCQNSARYEEDVAQKEQEIQNLSAFLDETAEKESAAREKLEEFISGLIDTADKSQTKVKALKKENKKLESTLNKTLELSMKLSPRKSASSPELGIGTENGSISDRSLSSYKRQPKQRKSHDSKVQRQPMSDSGIGNSSTTENIHSQRSSPGRNDLQRELSVDDDGILWDDNRLTQSLHGGYPSTTHPTHESKKRGKCRTQSAPQKGNVSNRRKNSYNSEFDSDGSMHSAMSCDLNPSNDNVLDLINHLSVSDKESIHEDPNNSDNGRLLLKASKETIKIQQRQQEELDIQLGMLRSQKQELDTLNHLTNTAPWDIKAANQMTKNPAKSTNKKDTERHTNKNGTCLNQLASRQKRSLKSSNRKENCVVDSTNQKVLQTKQLINSEDIVKVGSEKAKKVVKADDEMLKKGKQSTNDRKKGTMKVVHAKSHGKNHKNEIPEFTHQHDKWGISTQQSDHSTVKKNKIKRTPSKNDSDIHHETVGRVSKNKLTGEFRTNKNASQLPLAKDIEVVQKNNIPDFNRNKGNDDIAEATSGSDTHSEIVAQDDNSRASNKTKRTFSVMDGKLQSNKDEVPITRTPHKRRVLPDPNLIPENDVGNESEANPRNVAINPDSISHVGDSYVETGASNSSLNTSFHDDIPPFQNSGRFQDGCQSRVDGDKSNIHKVQQLSENHPQSDIDQEDQSSHESLYSTEMDYHLSQNGLHSAEDSHLSDDGSWTNRSGDVFFEKELEEARSRPNSGLPPKSPRHPKKMVAPPKPPRKFSRDQSNMSDILFCVFMYLDTRNLSKMATICKKWRSVSHHPALWRRVVLKHGMMSSKYLMTISTWCTQVKVLILEDLTPRRRYKNESLDDYETANKGSLEPGLESLFRASQDSIVSVNLHDCGNLITERCLWLVSNYCRNLHSLEYISDFDTVGPEVMWALGVGCGGITNMNIHPLYPNENPDKFSKRCVQLIGECWPEIQHLTIGGQHVEVAGLTSIVVNCQDLKVLELYNIPSFGVDTTSAMMSPGGGLKNLQFLSVCFSAVQPKALLVFARSCLQLQTIHVHVKISDYFKDVSDKRNIKQFQATMDEFKDLKRTDLAGILTYKFG